MGLVAALVAGTGFSMATPETSKLFVGWLDEDAYAPAARKAFLALQDFIEPNGAVREVCCCTNVGSSRDHYAKRPRVTGDLHGQAPVLWCCAALAEYLAPSAD